MLANKVKDNIQNFILKEYVENQYKEIYLKRGKQASKLKLTKDYTLENEAKTEIYKLHYEFAGENKEFTGEIKYIKIENKKSTVVYSKKLTSKSNLHPYTKFNGLTVGDIIRY